MTAPMALFHLLELVTTVESLNDTTHACFRDTSPSKDLNGLVRNKVGHSCTLILEQCQWPSEDGSLLHVGMVIHLVGQVIHPLSLRRETIKSIARYEIDTIASLRETISASFWRITGWARSFFPKTLRWFAHLKHSSITYRVARFTPTHMAHRS